MDSKRLSGWMTWTALVAGLTFSTLAQADEPRAGVTWPSTESGYKPGRDRTEATMAKTTSWGGGISGDWGVAGNWSNGLPANTDTVIFPSTATRDVTAGLDQNAIEILLLDIKPGCVCNIGLPGNPLRIADGAGSATFYHAGSGTLYIDTTLGQMFVQSPNLVNALINLGGVFGRLVITKGRVINANGASVLEVLYDNNPSSDARLYSSGAGGTTQIITAGRVEAAGVATTVQMSGGSYTFIGNAITTLWQSGGVIYHNGTAGITTARLMGGVLDFSANNNEVSITNLYLYPDAELIRTPTLTVTNEYRIKIYD